MVFVNPRSTKFGIFDKYVPLSVPIGVGSLAGYLRKQGEPVLVLDEHVVCITPELLKGLKFPPGQTPVFGISTLTACAKRSYEIARLIKQTLPGALVILGGIHPTVLPEEVLGNKDVDFLFRGEAEEILLEFLRRLSSGRDVRSIPGLSYRKNGEIAHNPAAALPDLSAMPAFPYDMFENSQDRYSFGFIASSRGCPYDCIFCSQRVISGQKYRYKPSPVVLEEIEQLVLKYGQSHINFVDDNFTANKKRVVELCEGILQRGFHRRVTFDCQTRADAVDDEILSLLKKSGFRLINFGFETASERLMKILNKRETVQENRDAVALAKKHGFGVSGTFIFGLPTETRRERWQAYEMATEMDLDYVRFNNATPYPGTRLYEIAREEGRLFVAPDWSNLNACGSLVHDRSIESRLPYVPEGSDEKTLRKDVVRANLYFSLRPKRVLRLLLKRVGPAGWFYLPPRWYCRPQEWWGLLKLGTSLFTTFLRSMF
ncbi:MAG: radical SAM protein [Candidatus Omnitrophota bacterium]